MSRIARGNGGARRDRRARRVRARRRRARASHRDRRTCRGDASRRAARHRDRSRRRSLRGHRLLGRAGARHAVRRPCRACAAAARRMCAMRMDGVQPSNGLARPRRRRPRPPHRRQGAAAAGRRASIPSGPIRRRPCAPPRRRAARSRRAGHQHLPDHLPRPAHGHLRRLRRRQVGAALDDGALHGRRRRGDRARRRARPRGPGIPPGRSRRGGPRAAPSSSSRPPTSRP